MIEALHGAWPHGFAAAAAVLREPGYVVQGRAAWGCSRWRSGCRLELPFVVAGRSLGDEELRRLLSRARATRYREGWLDDRGRPIRGRARLVIDPEAEHGWRLQRQRRRGRGR